MFIRRLEQFSPTEDNISELRDVADAVNYVYLLKRAELENILNGDDNGQVQKSRKTTHGL